MLRVEYYNQEDTASTLATQVRGEFDDLVNKKLTIRAGTEMPKDDFKTDSKTPVR